VGIAGALERPGMLGEPVVQAEERRRPEPLPAGSRKRPHAASSCRLAALCMRSFMRDMARVCTCETRDSEIPSVRPISLSVRCS